MTLPSINASTAAFDSKEKDAVDKVGAEVSLNIGRDLKIASSNLNNLRAFPCSIDDIFFQQFMKELYVSNDGDEHLKDTLFLAKLAHKLRTERNMI